MASPKQTPGEWLQERRSRAGYSSAAAFGRALNVDRTTAARWERDASKIPPERVPDIAELLDLDLDEAYRRLLEIKPHIRAVPPLEETERGPAPPDLEQAAEGVVEVVLEIMDRYPGLFERLLKRRQQRRDEGAG